MAWFFRRMAVPNVTPMAVKAFSSMEPKIHLFQICAWDVLIFLVMWSVFTASASKQTSLTIQYSFSRLLKPVFCPVLCSPLHFLSYTHLASLMNQRAHRLSRSLLSGFSLNGHLLNTFYVSGPGLVPPCNAKQE